jgi:peroxiredoxin (alkyl hydroperoxide reductase subunit C)
MPEANNNIIEPTVGQTAAAPPVKEVVTRVGREAVDFEADAFIAGKGFSRIKLSDYRRRKCVVLLFYPGDFTFV